MGTCTSTPNCMPPSTLPSISQITFPSSLELRTPIAFSYLWKNSSGFKETKGWLPNVPHPIQGAEVVQPQLLRELRAAGDALVRRPALLAARAAAKTARERRRRRGRKSISVHLGGTWNTRCSEKSRKKGAVHRPTAHYPTASLTAQRPSSSATARALANFPRPLSPLQLSPSLSNAPTVDGQNSQTAPVGMEETLNTGINHNILHIHNSLGISGIFFGAKLRLCVCVCVCVCLRVCSMM